MKPWDEQSFGVLAEPVFCESCKVDIDPRDKLNFCEKCSTCVDCRAKPGTVHYCGGAQRCAECSEIFKEKNRAERRLRENKVHLCECGESYMGEYGCPHCCEHEFDADEGYHCLNCGTDGSEEVMSNAYDQAKDRMKYGS